MISDTLNKQIVEAMKAGEAVRVLTLKMLSAALTNAEIAKRPGKLTPEDELKVVQSEAKKRKDAIEIYARVRDRDRAEREKKELEILQEFLPEELSDEELGEIIDETMQQFNHVTMAHLGQIMGVIMQKVGGRADGNRVSQLVRQKLS